MNSEVPGGVVSCSPFTADPTLSDQFRFLTIYDYTLNAFVFDAGFLARTVNSVTISANTLRSGDLFGYELIDSDRLVVPATNSFFDTTLLFDRRTTGTFRTAAAAVPEPGVLQFGTLLAMFGAVVGLYARRKRTVLS